MTHKTKYSELPSGACFQRGKRKGVRKKLPDGRVVSISARGKVTTRAMKGDPKVNIVSCPLKFLGTGLRRVPDAVIEIGRKELRRR